MNFDPHQLVAWGGFLLCVLALLLFDLLVLHRDEHEIRMKEALVGAAVPVAMAMAFAAVILYAYQFHCCTLGTLTDRARDAIARDPNEAAYYPTDGFSACLLYVTGYLVELSLSADNVFLFVILMRYFSVPAQLQHRVLFWGIIGALAMRAFMIVIGGALLLLFGWIIYIFGAIILITGIKMLFTGEEDKDPGNSIGVRIARKLLPIHPAYEGNRFLVRKPAADGRIRTFATTLFVVLVCIEVTDLIFALDSIPAIFGITKDTFIVFTSNVFAIIGLRSLYFLLAGVIDKFHLLKYGLAVVLAFVGFKMVLPLVGHLYAHFAGVEAEHWHVNKYLALGVIVVSLTASIVASLVFPKPRGAGAARSRPGEAEAERD